MNQFEINEINFVADPQIMQEENSTIDEMLFKTQFKCKCCLPTLVEMRMLMLSCETKLMRMVMINSKNKLMRMLMIIYDEC